MRPAYAWIEQRLAPRDEVASPFRGLCDEVNEVRPTGGVLLCCQAIAANQGLACRVVCSRRQKMQGCIYEAATGSAKAVCLV